MFQTTIKSPIDFLADGGKSRLAVDNVSKTYKSRTVVDSVSLYVEAGEIVGLMGANGAGKSTTFNLIIGLEFCETGRIQLDNLEITQLPMPTRAKLGVGYLPQEPSVFRKLSVEDNVRAILENRRFKSKSAMENRLDELLHTFGIEDVRKTLGLSLSGGERRRVEIARAFAMDPQFILLDEPFAGVDPIAIVDVAKQIEFLQRENIGILITDHNVRETLGICQRAYIMNEGKVIASGVPGDIMANPVVKESYLGKNFNL